MSEKPMQEKDNPSTLRMPFLLRLTPWFVHVFAVVITLATLLIRMKFDVFFNQRPLLILFMLPIILSAYMGGLWGGLLATLTAALSVLYFLIPPIHSFQISAFHDFIQWIILIVSGVLVSVLNESLHRARRGVEQLVDKRKLAEQTLRESAAILTMAEEVAQIGSWFWDLRTQKVTWSEQMFRLFGVEREGFDGDVNRVVSERVHPDDAAAVFESNRNVLEEDNPIPLSYRLVLPDGTERTVWAQGKMIRDDAGQPIALTGYVQDITERMQAEKKILQMKRLYATLSQVNQTIVRVKSHDELYRSICDIAVKFGEFSLAWIGLLDEDTGDINPVEAVGLDVKQWPFEIVNIRKGHNKNGLVAVAINTSRVVTSEDLLSDERTQHLQAQIQKYGYHSSAAVPIRLNDRIIGVLGLVSQEIGLFRSEDEILLLNEMGLDISFALDMMATEKLKRQWADAFEHCAHGIAIGHPFTNQIITCNAAFARLQGESIQEISSKSLLSVYAPQDREQIKQFIDQSDRTGSVQFEARKIRKDGSIYDVQMDLVSVRDEDGNLLYRVATQQDITERKKTETALRESEERYRLISDNTADVIWVMDPIAGRFTYVSPSVVKLRGYTPAEVMAQPVSESLTPDSLRLVSEALAANLPAFIQRGEGTASFVNEVDQPCRDGSIVHTEVTTTNLFNSKGQVEIVGVSRDITARRQAEEALKKNERVLRLFVEHSPASIAMFDLDMKYIIASRRYLVDYGLGEQDLTGRSHYEVFPEIPERWKEIHRRCLAGAIERADEDPFPRADGHIDWVHWEIHPWYENTGKIGGVILFSEVITERKQAHEALLESEALFSKVFQSSPIGINIFDPFDGHSVNVNDAFLDIVGYSRAEVIDHSAAELNLFVDAEARNGWMKTLREGGLVRNQDAKIRNKSGEIRSCLASLDIIEINGKPMVLVITSDITERNKVEEALKVSEERMRLTLQTTSDGFWIIDSVGRFLEVNNAYCDMSGYTCEELMQMGLHDVEVFENHQATEQRIEKIRYESHDRFETRHRRKDGSVFDVEVSVNILDKNSGIMICFCRDITERKQAEQALRDANEKYRNIFENAVEAITQTTPEGGYISANPATVQMLGYDSIEDLVTGLSDLERQFYVKPGRREEFRKLMEQYGTISDFESEVYRKDGSRIWISENSHAVRDGHGKVLYYEGTGQDITRRKHAEREIQQRAEDLFLISALNDAANHGEDIEGITEVFAHQARNMFSCQAAAIYLLSADGKYIVMQSNTLPRKLTERIEKLIGHPIPKIQIPLRKDGYFQKILENEQGLITSDPREIQDWIGEFTSTTFLPALIRAAIRKVVPQIYKVLNIGSTISIPLVNSGRAFGVLDMSSKGQFTDDDLRRIRSISHQVTAVSLRKQAEEQVQLQLERMRALSEIDRAISSSLDMRLSLDILLNQVITQLGVDAAAVLLLNQSSQTLEYEAGRGFRSLSIRESRMVLGQDIPGRAGLERKVIHIPDLAVINEQFQRRELLKDENFMEYFGIPLIAKGMVKGVLEVFHRSPLNPDVEWVNYLETLGGQAAIAIDNAQLFNGMQQSNLELITAYDATIVGWSRAMDLRDKETEGHTQRVTELAAQLAKKMGMSQQDIVQLRRGALLHDIGKLGVPDQILHKPDKLTQIEWAIMRQHPTYAFNMLMSINYLRPALDIPYCHHEKWDGTGYPRGLKGEEIPLAARVFAIVDVWDALCSDRPYRAGWPVEKVREYLIEETGRHFDPQVAKAFLQIIEDNGV